MGANEWRTTEVSILRERYPVAGAVGCRDLLPGRSCQAISAKASTLGLKAPTASPFAGKKRYHANDHVDEAIRRFYAKPIQRGELPRFSEGINRPSWWVKERAIQLGVSVPRTKPAPWSQAELAILRGNAALQPKRIASKLKAAGYDRTPTAVAVRMKRMDGIDRTDPDTFTFHELAALLGVDDKTVRRWHEKEGLPAKRKHQDVPGGTWLVTRRQLRSWMASHQQLIDLRKVDRFWFLDLVFSS